VTPHSVRLPLAFSALLVCALLQPVRLAAQERLLVNARVFTGNSSQPYAEAVAIRGDRIVAVGNRAEVAAGLGGAPDVIDLQGKTLLPGLIDSHSHPALSGVSLVSADVGSAIGSVDELLPVAADAKSSGRGMRGDVLMISGIPLEIWSHTDQLNARFSSGEYAKQPVYLEGMDGHTGWANAALRKRAGLDAKYLRGLGDDDRKYYGFGSDLTPNGFAVDQGLEIVLKQVPAPDERTLQAGGEAAVRYLNSLGITAWLDAAVDHKALAVYRSLAEAKKLTASVAAFVVVEPGGKDPLAEMLALRKEFANVPGLTLPGVKVFADGVAEYPSQSAAMSTPYAITGKTGDLLYKPEDYARLCIDADKRGLIVHVHAIGDRAVTESLNGIEAARKTNGASGLPHTITHLQFVKPSDFPRFKQFGVIASFQLYWATADVDAIDLVKPYVSPDIYPWQYPARSMLDAGATIAGASDWSVSTPNVFAAIYQAETRRGEQGVLNASQIMPREAMLYAYTINAARALNQQDRIGSIEPGKPADLTLVDRDVVAVPAEEMKDAKVLWTMVGGEWVYRAE
jgi:predicted amidohydrolase YtcJ